MNDTQENELGAWFAELLSRFDGETNVEKSENYVMGYKAVRKPELLTAQQLFSVSFLIERMQKCGFADAVKLEEVRLHILSKLNGLAILHNPYELKPCDGISDIEESLRAMILERLVDIGSLNNNYSTSLQRWRNFYANPDGTGVHISKLNFVYLSDKELLHLYDRVIMRCAKQM